MKAIHIFQKTIIALLLTVYILPLGAQNAKHSYDYQNIAPHPRLLLSDADEKDMLEAIAEVPEFKTITDYIIAESDKFIDEKPVFFQKKGKRLLWVSRIALTRLYYLSYSYRVTGEKKYLDRAEVELNAICEFESWNPSHFLDVGEMTMAVAIAYDWMYDDMTENTKANVREAIIEKAFKPSYVKAYNWFYDRHSNWNSVCNAGLVYGALAIMEHAPEQCIPIIEKALETNKLPLTAFGPDGNYPEGPGYWAYGASFQVMLVAALESALGTDHGLSQAEGFMRSSEYMLFVGGPSGEYFNYYDCGPEREALAAMFWFADKTNNPSLVYQEMVAIREGIYTLDVISNIERVLPCAVVFGRNLDLHNLKAPVKNVFTGHGITPVTLVHTEWGKLSNKFLGIKGGSASDGHAHADQGTFVYDIGNVRWASDFGLQSYGSLEEKGVDLWNSAQNAQRWEVFRYNNLNHNTLSINGQLHNINGRSEIIETYETGRELGAKVELTSVLNRNNELKSAVRKAVIVDKSYLQIEDLIQTNDQEVSVRWNMVTPAQVERVNKSTFKLSQKGKSVLFEVNANVPFKLAIRPCEDPSKEKCDFTGKKYDYFNYKNPGRVMIGFDADVDANETAKFTVTIKEIREQIKLPANVLLLDAPNPSVASEGDNRYTDSSPIGIDSEGYALAMGTPDWIPYAKLNNAALHNKSFSFLINAKRISASGIVNAGIDRSADGQLGVRGGENNGIENNEGYLLGLDLSNIDPEVTFELSGIAISHLDGAETAMLVNRLSSTKMMHIESSTEKSYRKVTPSLEKELFDVSELGITLKGGMKYDEILSVFNTGTGNFRISGFEFKIK